MSVNYFVNNWPLVLFLLLHKLLTPYNIHGKELFVTYISHALGSCDFVGQNVFILVLGTFMGQKAGSELRHCICHLYTRLKYTQLYSLHAKYPGGTSFLVVSCVRLIHLPALHFNSHS